MRRDLAAARADRRGAPDPWRRPRAEARRRQRLRCQRAEFRGPPTAQWRGQDPHRPRRRAPDPARPVDRHRHRHDDIRARPAGRPHRGSAGLHQQHADRLGCSPTRQIRSMSPPAGCAAASCRSTDSPLSIPFAGYSFDIFFLGISGMTADGLFDYSPEDAEVETGLHGSVGQGCGAMRTRRSSIARRWCASQNRTRSMPWSAMRRRDGALADALSRVGIDVIVA